LNEIKSFNIKSKKNIICIDATSVTTPVLVDQNKCETDIDHVSGSIESMEVFEESAEENESLSDDNDTSELEYTSCDKKSAVPSLVSQLELNDLVRDLGLPKDGSELLASFLKKKNLLQPKTKVFFYRNRNSEFRNFFVIDKDLSLVFCTDVESLIVERKFL